MKKLFFLFAFMGIFAFAAEAQTKACCASKAGAKVCSKTMDKAASADASVVKQVSNKGEVTYVRKDVCPMSGKVSMKQVEYCTKSGKFVNVSPSEAKAACTKKASATKVSSTSKKAACCKKGSKAACTKNASAKKAATTSSAKLVKNEESN